MEAGGSVNPVGFKGRIGKGATAVVEALRNQARFGSDDEHPAKPTLSALHQMHPPAAVAGVVAVLRWGFDQFLTYSYGRPPKGHEPVLNILTLAKEWSLAPSSTGAATIADAGRSVVIRYTPSPEESAKLLSDFFRNTTRFQPLWEAFENSIRWMCSLDLPYYFDDLERAVLFRIRDAALSAALGKVAQSERPAVPAERRYHVVTKGRSHGGPMELEITTNYFVIDKTTKSHVMSFVGHADYGLQNLSTGEWEEPSLSGVTNVTVEADGKYVVVESADGSKAKKKIPRH
jgi:hypothetical protein